MLAQLGNPEPNHIILNLSDETYYLDATREWTFSQQAMQVVDDQVVLDTVLDQPLGALRDVSYQLYCGDEILESYFPHKNLSKFLKTANSRDMKFMSKFKLKHACSSVTATCP